MVEERVGDAEKDRLMVKRLKTIVGIRDKKR